MSLAFDQPKKQQKGLLQKRPRDNEKDSSTETLVEVKHEEDTKHEHEHQLRLFYSTNYYNGTPFPSVGIVHARDEKHAVAILDSRLLDSGLLTRNQQEKEHGKVYTIHELDNKEPGCYLLTQGRDIFK